MTFTQINDNEYDSLSDEEFDGEDAKKLISDSKKCAEPDGYHEISLKSINEDDPVYEECSS